MYSGMQQAADHSVDNVIIDNRFLGKTNESYERYVFNTRNQKAHETADDYISALCSLASTCNFCDCLKDSLLRDRIVLGIKDSSTRKRLLQEADLNLDTCIAMCRAAEATSPSQPVKTVTWTEDTSAVEAGSGDQRPDKKQDFSMRRCEQKVSPDEVELSEVNFKMELDDPDDGSALQWTSEHQSSGFPWDRTEHNKLKPPWSIEEDSPDQPSAVYSTVQPMSDNTSGSLLSVDSKHACYLCSAAFVLVSSLELHLASVHGEKLDIVLPGSSTPDRCDAGDCSNTDIDTETESQGNRNLTKTKNDNNDIGDEEGQNKNVQYVCNVCTKSFPTSSKLERHNSIHSGVKPFVCNMCSKSFNQASILKRHKLTHSSLKPFVCDVCSKSFNRVSSLTQHKRVHTGERPYKCPHCDSHFTQSGHLQLHIKSVHEDARPHVCDVCGAAFSKTGHLARHKRIHTGEKPYVCSDCGKGFADSGNLANHRLTHSGQKPHSCPQCPAAFKWPVSLKRHVQNVHQ